MKPGGNSRFLIFEKEVCSLSYRLRAIISCLLAVGLCGTSLGLRGKRDVDIAAAAHREGTFHYSGFSREAFPALIGPFLRNGKYRPFASVATPAFPIPALGEGYVPQGMCYSQALGWFALAYYHPDKRPGLLALVDAESGEFVKMVYLLKPGGLPYTGHAGGAAAWGEHLWVTSESRAWRLAAQDLREAQNGGTVRFRDTFRSASRGGIAFVAEGMLWLGDSYAHGRSHPLPESHLDPESGNRAWCVGYPLKEDSPTGVAGYPAAVLSIQDSAQGACMAASSGEFIISVSFTAAAPSWLWVYPTLRGILEQMPDRKVTVENRECPLWVVDPAMATGKQMLAPMSEGICEYGGKIYTWYESAALLYRDRAEMYADYVFSLEEGRFLPR